MPAYGKDVVARATTTFLRDHKFCSLFFFSKMKKQYRARPLASNGNKLD